MTIYNTTAYWDNDFDHMFDEAIDELERTEKKEGESNA